MLLMVFVNDLWTIGDVPHWLEHFERLEDGMGLADIVFPMFLFAMGMSVPYAIESRFSKGYSGESTLGHVLSRTLALLLMGVFIVNTEGGFDSGVWCQCLSPADGCCILPDLESIRQGIQIEEATAVMRPGHPGVSCLHFPHAGGRISLCTMVGNTRNSRLDLLLCCSHISSDPQETFTCSMGVDRALCAEPAYD